MGKQPITILYISLIVGLLVMVAVVGATTDTMEGNQSNLSWQFPPASGDGIPGNQSVNMTGPATNGSVSAGNGVNHMGFNSSSGYNAGTSASPIHDSYWEDALLPNVSDVEKNENVQNVSVPETIVPDESVYGIARGTRSMVSTENPGTDKSEPRVSGSRIVWQGNDNRNNYNIHLYDLESGNETLVTPFLETSDQTAPAISGDRIVYEDTRNGKSDIYLYTISSGKTTRLTGDAGNQHSPAISGNYVVWQDEQDGNYLVQLYNLATSEVRQVSANSSYQEAPAIYGNIVAWAEWRDDNYEISCYNITSGIERRVTNTTDLETNPAVWGDRIVYQVLMGASTNIRLFNLTTGEDIAITNSSWDHVESQICEDRVVWTDKRNYSDIFMFNLSDSSYTLVTPGDSLSARQTPAIDENRIVWSGSDESTSSYEIYLLTLGEPRSPLLAGFSVDHTQGHLPLSVNFTDTSPGSPRSWHWDFGDGNVSREQNPSHVYTNAGLYTVSLTVSNPYQRSATVKFDLVASGSAPSAAFTTDSTSGPAPASIAFTDISTGYPTAWHWDFGDGNISGEQNPVHLYVVPGLYTVNLTVSNQFGNMSAEKTSFIRILPVVGVLGHAEIPGIVITGSDQGRFLYLNTSQLQGFSMVDPTNLTVLNLNPHNGTVIGSVSYVSDSAGFSRDNTSVWGNVTGMVLSGTVPVSGLGDPDLDPCSLFYSVNTGTPSSNISLESIAWAGVTPDDFARYEKKILAEGYAGIGGTAYSIRFRNEDPALEGPALVTMSVRPYWVLTHGQRQGDRTVEESVRILRIGDDGLVEILDTEYVGCDSVKGLEYFTAVSPHGLSTFTLSTLTGTGNPLQLAYLSVSSRVNTNSGGGSAGGGGSGGGGGGYGGNSGLSVPASSPVPTESAGNPEDSTLSSSHGGEVQPSSPGPGSISTGPGSSVAPSETLVSGAHSGAVAASQTPGSSIFSLVLQGAVVVSVVLIVVFSVYTRYRRDE